MDGTVATPADKTKYPTVATARWRSKHHRLRALGFLVIPGGVGIGALFFWQVPGNGGMFGLVASSLVGGVLGGLVFRSAPRFFCPICDKLIPTQMAWNCAHCDASNHGFTRSFLDSCHQCGKQPARLACPHSTIINEVGRGKLHHHFIDFEDVTVEGQLRLPARRSTIALPGETHEQTVARDQRERAALLIESGQAMALFGTAVQNVRQQQEALQMALDPPPPPAKRTAPPPPTREEQLRAQLTVAAKAARNREVLKTEEEEALQKLRNNGFDGLFNTASQQDLALAERVIRTHYTELIEGKRPR